jgi:alpha-tubulin suppressor-like RCC1 family protein
MGRTGRLGVCVTVVFALSMVAVSASWASGVVAWGDGEQGQLGDGMIINRDVPVAASLPSGVTVTAVAAGFEHSLALLSDHAVMAWGANDHGQLGDGNTSNSEVPVAVDLSSLPAGDVVTAVSAGARDSLALLNTGEVIAWGDNEEGQLGDGTTIAYSDVPVAVCTVASSGSCLVGNSNALTGVEEVSAGADHSLALLNTGEVRAWGYNYVGELGDGTTSGPEACYGGGACSRRPVAVSGLSGVTAVSAGWLHSIALLNTGEVRSWGGNGDGDLGDGNSTSNSDEPVAVCNVSGPCSGGNVLTGVAEVSAGDEYSLVRLAGAGEVLAWGDNELGGLGDGTAAGPDMCSGLACSTRPVAVCEAGATYPCTGNGNVLTGVTELSAGAAHSLARLSDGTVTAWGDNHFGELGDGTTSGPEICATHACSTRPVAVTGLSGVTGVAAGGFHSLIIGTSAPPASDCLVAWGAGEYGALGDGNSSGDADTPVPVNLSALPSGVGVTAVATGEYHNLALLNTGEVIAWGWNAFGALGNNTTINSDVPVDVQGLLGAGLLTGVTGVAAGWFYSMAVLNTGEVLAWGRNAFGQLGDGNTADSHVPVAVSGLSGVTAVAANAENALALLNTGEVMAWGDGASGQLGNGTTTTINDLPVKVSGQFGVGFLTGVAAVSAGSYGSLALLSPDFAGSGVM